MTKPTKTISINTGGGDAPGLNAVIQSAVYAASHLGWKVYGIREGYDGLLFPDRYPDGGLVELNPDKVEGIGRMGGTILGSTNRGNPFRALEKAQDGTLREVDKSDLDMEAFRKHGIDAHIAVGGSLVHGLVTSERKRATVRVADYTAMVGPEEIRWTGASSPSALLHPGDVTLFLVTEVDSQRKRMRLALDQEPLVEGALVALEPAIGEVKALVGGYDFERSEFYRATQTLRQPGSAFKPFVYLAALDSGYTLADILFDEPTVSVDSRSNVEYHPENYTRQYYGSMTLRTALEESRNIVSVKLINQVGSWFSPGELISSLTSTCQFVSLKLCQTTAESIQSNNAHSLISIPKGVSHGWLSYFA